MEAFIGACKLAGSALVVPIVQAGWTWATSSDGQQRISKVAQLYSLSRLLDWISRNPTTFRLTAAVCLAGGSIALLYQRLESDRRAALQTTDPKLARRLVKQSERSFWQLAAASVFCVSVFAAAVVYLSNHRPWDGAQGSSIHPRVDVEELRRAAENLPTGAYAVFHNTSGKPCRVRCYHPWGDFGRLKVPGWTPNRDVVVAPGYAVFLPAGALANTFANKVCVCVDDNCKTFPDKTLLFPADFLSSDPSA